MADAQKNIHRIDGELHQVTPVQDENGNIVARTSSRCSWNCPSRTFGTLPASMSATVTDAIT